MSYIGEYTIKGLHGTWVFWDYSSEDDMMWFVAATYPQLPEPLYSENSPAAENIKELNTDRTDTKFIRVPSTYVSKKFPEVEDLTLF